MKSPCRLAFVYDRINTTGGAERVLKVLHQAYPQAPVFTAVYSKKGAPWAKNWDIRPSILNHLPGASSRHEWLVPLTPWAFKHFNFSPFDVVVSLTSAEAKGISVNPPTKHLCYLLTPTRYLWHQTHLHQGRGLKAALRLPFLSALRLWDYQAAQKPDEIIAISQSVAARCQKYYRRQPQAIVYPPVDTQVFSQHPTTCFSPLRDYFLLVSRLVPQKSIAYVIQTFKNLPNSLLVIVGTGRQQADLHRQAKDAPNIHFEGFVTDNHLNCLYHHARALIFPQEEDFGITAVEAQAAGIPVIAYNRGGARETVIQGKTGVLYHQQTQSSLAQALKDFHNTRIFPKDCYDNTQKFDTKEFIRKFTKLLEPLCQTQRSR